MGLILGIDTSCYTTSVALVDNAGKLVADERQLLSVAEGERGLQQSAAVFQHIRNLPGLIEKLSLRDRRDSVVLVAASTRPRPVAGSYMPVFMVSEGFARTLAEALQIPFTATSHQEAHLMAGLWSAGGPAKDRFLAIHLSGGTSELLLVERNQETGSAPLYPGDTPMFKVEKLGGTTDLHAGQFVDRIGVALGLSFPCGPELQKLAEGAEGVIKAPSVVRGMDISFSGPESHLRRVIAEGNAPREIARAVEHCIATTMEKLIRRGMDSTGIKDILMVGGVAANNYLRHRLVARLGHPSAGTSLYFAEPRFSTDNAVGTAIMGLQRNKDYKNTEGVLKDI